MIPLSKPAKIIEETESKALFEIEGLYPGYGVTVGNSLRRVLLSSLGGAAVTQVKIKGAPHEFTTLPGVLEDSVALLLNLKQMRFVMTGEESQLATLKVKGERKVKGSDFKFPSQVELVNKDIHIATLTSKSAELEMEIRIEKGVGYVRAEDLKNEKGEIGVITLDAIFTPIRRVSFSVQNMRVGERTDFDKLTLEVETDGTIASREAFLEACDILTKEFEVISQDLKARQAEELLAKQTKAEGEKKVSRPLGKKKKTAGSKKEKK